MPLSLIKVCAVTLNYIFSVNVISDPIKLFVQGICTQPLVLELWGKEYAVTLTQGVMTLNQRSIPTKKAKVKAISFEFFFYLIVHY